LFGQSLFWPHLQEPPLQVLVAPEQALPHDPQLALSLVVFTQALPQTFVPDAQATQRLLVQVALVPQSLWLLQSGLQVPASQ
jgi:hypothetical protein